MNRIVKAIHPGASLLIALIFMYGINAAMATADAQISRPGQNAQPYNEHTPSFQAMRSAKRAYEAGQHFSALSGFKSAARWADKFAQFNVGAMYLRGEGTEFDPVRAWAWFELAAERDYPDMVETADNLWRKLDAGQHRQAQSILQDELLPKYGDDVAIEKTARKMQRELREATGSRLGAAGSLQIIDGDGRRREGAEYFAEEKWNFRNLVQYETAVVFAIEQGRVELGEFQVLEDEDANENQSDNEQ